MKPIAPAAYKKLREKIGTQAEVAARLEIKRETIARRETKGPITREAWLALQQVLKDSQK